MRNIQSEKDKSLNGTNQIGNENWREVKQQLIFHRGPWISYTGSFSA